MKAGCITLTLMAATAVVACGSPDQDELTKWMAEQRTLTRPNIQPIPEPKKYTPEPYTQESSTDPFSNQKLAQALKRESTQSAGSSALIQPELSRRREPLESYPLDAMTMVGSLVKQGQPVALVRVDNLLYQVRPGNYLGLNYGRITKVTENELVLRELAQDATGEWTERAATLQLQERSK